MAAVTTALTLCFHFPLCPLQRTPPLYGSSPAAGAPALCSLCSPLRLPDSQRYCTLHTSASWAFAAAPCLHAFAIPPPSQWGPYVCSGTCFWAILLLSTEHAWVIPRFPGSPKQASSLMLLPAKLHRHPTAIRVNSHDRSTALVQTYDQCFLL